MSTISIVVGNKDYDFLGPPSWCPFCYYALVPIEITHCVIEVIQNRVEFVYQCPRPVCGHLFIATYLTNEQYNILELSRVAPSLPREPCIPGEVAEISPSFVEIFSQALAAESYQLHQIAGVGLRKALEFLIKDYCIYLDEESADQIKASPLSVCIRDHVSDQNVKQCAERAVWLGNDETHYVRRWEDKDVEDLKALITLTSNWIQSSVLTTRYVDDMSR